ncbi:MAG TPA: penicillin acylase family protein, partial [Polyangia bacterium]
MHRIATAALLLSPLLFAAGCTHASPVASIPETDHVENPALSGPVDVVRDEQGIPHIYAGSIEDASFVEGYLMGEDRLVEADLARHSAEGTLAEIGGDLSPSLIDSDILMRMHHMKKTAEDEFTALKASTDPSAQLLVRSLGKFAAGMNAYVADLKSGRYTLPG